MSLGINEPLSTTAEHWHGTYVHTHGGIIGAGHHTHWEGGMLSLTDADFLPRLAPGQHGRLEAALDLIEDLVERGSEADYGNAITFLVEHGRAPGSTAYRRIGRRAHGWRG